MRVTGAGVLPKDTCKITHKGLILTVLVHSETELVIVELR